MVIVFWHHFLSKLCFCQPFHVSSESCHCLTSPSSHSSISTSPNSVSWASLLISFKVHLILLSAPMSVSHRLCLRSPGLRYFLSSCWVSHTLTRPRHTWAGHGIGATPDEREVRDTFRRSCPSGLWLMQMESSSLPRCSVPEVLHSYNTGLCIRKPNAFAGHLSQQHWHRSCKYVSFLAGLSQQPHGSTSWNTQLDWSSMLSKTLWNVGRFTNC